MNQEIIIIVVAIIVVIMINSGSRHQSTPAPTTFAPTTFAPTTFAPTSPTTDGYRERGVGKDGKINLPPLRNIPDSIKNILQEIGNGKPTLGQINRLETAVKSIIQNPTELVRELKNAPKDDSGFPKVADIKLEYFILMLMLFMFSEGRIYRDELGEDITNSYGSMPGKSTRSESF